ncbi:MAG TPA: 3-dehydroquinate synthase family protein [Spirochaetia bacterium]|nr:3-dehydroquinate synthase family protein [Spirochaetia bacterium]
MPEGRTLVLPPGEASKSWDSLRSALEFASGAGLPRDGTILGLGGGVVCDLAAFAASLYMRGSRLVLAPTSLVAMADAALGGKAAVDLAGVRNLAGSFYAADEVRLHLPFLLRLPEREYRAGLAEVLRTGLVAAPKVRSLLSERGADFGSRDPALLDETVRRCVLAKASLCERDPYDRGDRLRLNFGHTFAHALEALRPDILHGEAVAWGMARALDAGLELGLSDPEAAAEARSLIEAYGFETSYSGIEPEALLAAMRRDKKGLPGSLRLVLYKEECSVALVETPEAVALRALEKGLR